MFLLRFKKVDFLKSAHGTTWGAMAMAMAMAIVMVMAMAVAMAMVMVMGGGSKNGLQNVNREKLFCIISQKINP